MVTVSSPPLRAEVVTSHAITPVQKPAARRSAMRTYIEPAHGDPDVDEDEAEYAHDDGEERDHRVRHPQDLVFRRILGTTIVSAYIQQDSTTGLSAPCTCRMSRSTTRR